jgi:very-short-patch-repair endonuclease
VPVPRNSVRSIEVALSAWLATHHGVITRANLSEIGVSEPAVRTMLDTGRLIRVHPGVYMAASSVRTELQRAALLGAATGGVISHSTAGQLWGFRKLSRFRQLHVSVPHGYKFAVKDRPGSDLSIGDNRIHQSMDLRDEDRVVRDDGIVLTSPSRTVFDLASICSAEDLESIIEQGLDKEWFTIPTLHGVGRRLAGPGRDGSANFASVLAKREIWRRPTQSDEELRLANALERAGFTGVQRQFPIRLPNGAKIHADLAIPERMFLIEVDHVTWHGGRIETMYDRWRDRQCHRLGWSTERVPDTDLSAKRLKQTVSELAELIARAPETRALSRPVLRSDNSGGLERSDNRPRPA